MKKIAKKLKIDEFLRDILWTVGRYNSSTTDIPAMMYCFVHAVLVVELPHTPESVGDEMSNSLSIPCIETKVWNGLLFYIYYTV